MDDKKIKKYVSLVEDKKKLKKSSQSMIRKKKSPLAIKIRKGNEKSIIRAAKDRVFGSLSLEKQMKVCRVLAEFRDKLVNRVPGETRREILAWVINSLICLINPICGLITSLLWIVRNKLDDAICKRVRAKS